MTIITVTDEEAINGNLKKITMTASDKSKYDPFSFLKSKEEKIKELLKYELKRRLQIKFHLTLQVRLTKTRGDQVEVMEPHFHGRCHIVLKTEDINEAFRESMKKILTSFMEFHRQGSNWTLDKVTSVNIHIIKYKRLKGSSYIPLPAKLANKKAIVNVQNGNEKSFMWSVLAALHPVKTDAQRVTKYTDYQHTLDFTNITFPGRVLEIPKFEKLNHISIKVFGYEKNKVYPLHLTK